ncbi:MAG: ATPase [Chlorobi bacterium]|nr:ATPase [Chlorobiota bacterium]
MRRLLDSLIELWKSLRESFKTFLRETQTATTRTITALALIAGTLSVGLLILYHGFPLSQRAKYIIVELIHVIFVIYVFNFFVRLLYSHNKLETLRRRWVEAVIILILTFDLFSFYFIGVPLLEYIAQNAGFENYYPIYVTLVQILLFALLLIEVVRFSQWVMYLHIRPATMLIVSFLTLISVATLLLMLPEMTVNGRISFIDALFTATSATCVTGLTVVDTGTYFTLKGQLIILLFIQLGGIGIVSFATFFVIFLRRGMAIHHQLQLQEQLAQESLQDVFKLLKEVLVYTFIFELLGAVFIFLAWNPELQFGSLSERIYYSIFHSVSAFCNAGFSLFNNSYYTYPLSQNYQLHMITATLIVLGGLGFPALKDLFSKDSLVERLRLPWKRLKTSTHMAVYVSLILIALGTIMIFMLEKNNLFKTYSSAEALAHSFFQSITARTAGFNTIDISSLSTATLLFLIFLMFIGASSGSTGGGIKISTFTIITLTVWAVVRNKKEVHYRNRRIPQELQYRAFAILAFSIIIVSVSIFLLSIVESDKNFRDVVFEVFSAFGTVGLSTGITPELSTIGKLIIIVDMFIGRVGPLTMAFALASATRSGLYSLPKTNVMIG